MNIFSTDSRWTSGLGDLGPIWHKIFSILGPIATILLGGLFVFILVKNIIPLSSPDVSDEEKSKHKKNLFMWGLSIGIIAFASLIVTILFFTLGKSASEVTSNGGTSGSGTSASHMLIHQIFACVTSELSLK